MLVTEPVPETWFSKMPSWRRYGFKGFLPFFLAYLMIFSKWSMLNALQNFEKSSNTYGPWQKMKKSLVFKSK
jgi:hypothetical protein